MRMGGDVCRRGECVTLDGGDGERRMNGDTPLAREDDGQGGTRAAGHTGQKRTISDHFRGYSYNQSHFRTELDRAGSGGCDRDHGSVTAIN